MTSKADFTEEEWASLKRAPFVAGIAIRDQRALDPLVLPDRSIAQR
jgi:hypothetical protein